MLKILHSCHTWLNTTETWLHTQHRFLPPDIESHVACEKIANSDEFSIAQLHAFTSEPGWLRFSDRLLRKLQLRRHLGFLKRVGQKEKIQLLHSHVGWVGWRNLHVARRNRWPHLCSFYGADVGYVPLQDPVWKKRYSELFRTADGHTVQGTFMAESLRKLGCPDSKIRIHDLGVDLKQIPFKPRHWDGIGPLRVLIAASFREKKGIPIALEALGKLRSKLHLQITLIGDSFGDPRSVAEKPRILATLRDHRLQENTRLMGYQPHAVFLQQAYEHHLFLSPSLTAKDGDSEGGAPVSIIEAAASGMPIVSSRHCDIPRVILDGKTGLLADEGDIDGVATCIETFASNPAMWPAMLQAGRTHIETHFDARSQGLKLAELYREMIG